MCPLSTQDLNPGVDGDVDVDHAASRVLDGNVLVHAETGTTHRLTNIGIVPYEASIVIVATL